MDATRGMRRSPKATICYRACLPLILLEETLLNAARFNLSRHIIHTVGPIYSSTRAEKNAEQLASCYKKSLQLAVASSLKHIVRDPSSIYVLMCRNF